MSTTEQFTAGQRAPLEKPLAFMLAGKAIFTIENPQTGARFTFMIEHPEQREHEATRPPHFVNVLRGPDNEHDYTFLGTIFDGRTFRHGKKSPIGKDAPSAKAFEWLWRRLQARQSVEPACLFHEGKCGRCGKTLTVPESVRSGFGPTCTAKALSSGGAEG